MSKTTKKRKFQIEPNSLSPSEENATKNVLRRLRNSSEEIEVVDFEEKSFEPQQLEVVAKTLPSQTSLPRQTGESSQTRQTRQTPIAPERDFQRVANSITKTAVPAGLFKGKSKQLYDALYSLTRGAINPMRSVRIRKSKLMKLANIGSRATFETNIRLLESIGFILETVRVGEHEGNDFEVFLPEESQTSLTGQTSLTSYAQKLDRLVNTETRQTSQSSEPMNTYVSGVSKTSFKTNTNIDDEPFGAMNAILRDASEKIYGKPPRKSDSGKWREFAELIVMELQIAAARTDSISSVPAFLTEHLRRRLLGKTDAPKSKLSKSSQIRETQSAEVEQFVAEPLTVESREVVLKTFKEYIEKGQRDFVMSFEDTYTKEDWSFLMENL